jgi:hypothetical protein
MGWKGLKLGERSHEGGPPIVGRVPLGPSSLLNHIRIESEPTY